MKVVREKKKLIVLVAVVVLAVLIGVGVAVNATGSSGGIAKSVTFSEDMDGAYVYFRAVDAAGNVGEWSEPQRLFIDTDAPIVTCTVPNNTLTIAEGDVLELANYFTVTANGSNTDIDITYTIGDVECSTTEGLTAEGSSYTVVCTATKNGGKSGNTSMEIVVENALPEVDFSTVSVSGLIYRNQCIWYSRRYNSRNIINKRKWGCA